MEGWFVLFFLLENFSKDINVTYIGNLSPYLWRFAMARLLVCFNSFRLHSVTSIVLGTSWVLVS